MTRILPIILLTVGLVLLSSSFASAATPETGAQPLAQWCVLEEPATGTATTMDRPEPKLGRCWKKLAIGLVVPGCKGHAQLPPGYGIEPGPVRTHWTISQPVIDRIGIEPFLDLPPPRA